MSTCTFIQTTLKWTQEIRERGGRRERGGERENSNSKSLILKDSSVRSIWTYLTLTASPCYTTNINKQDDTTDTCISKNKQLINAQRENEETLFNEGSGEDSRSFYIQPSPMKETIENTMRYRIY